MFSFEVEDNGPGIPEHLQARVFEPFVQGDLGLSRKYGGTGLGLSICSQLANVLRGTIELKSIEKVGSKFTLTIPLKYVKECAASVASADASQRNSLSMSHLGTEQDDSNSVLSHMSVHSGQSTSQSKYPGAQPRLVGLSQPYFAPPLPATTPTDEVKTIDFPPGDKIRVLVAEDNRVNQEVVLQMLRLEEIYDVTVAQDGQEAVDLIKKALDQSKRFDLVLMDVQMPNLDGLESTRRIRTMGYKEPIVALTAFAEESNVKECYDAGMDFFLAKPIRRPQLKLVLNKFCCPTIKEEADEKSDKGSEKMKSPKIGGDSEKENIAELDGTPSSPALPGLQEKEG